MIILDGKKVSKEILDNVKQELDEIKEKIIFSIIWVGNNPASEIYVRNKLKKCTELGIQGTLYHLDEDTKEEDIIKLIDKLNKDKEVKGILLQSPVPKGIDINKCFNKIDYHKDIDGFSNVSVGNLWLGEKGFRSCTPKGIIKLLDYYDIPLEGKNVCIINRSNIVGKPLAALFLERNATVTICHSHTKNIEEHTKMADIVVSAVGKPKFIKEDMIKEGTIVIDVGISRENGHVIGDVDFDRVKEKAAFITPVPGGVGPMTIAMIFENIIEAVKEKKNG